jgi:hypothetical protein
MKKTSRSRDGRLPTPDRLGADEPFSQTAFEDALRKAGQKVSEAEPEKTQSSE